MNDTLKRKIIHQLANEGVAANYNPWGIVKARLEMNAAIHPYARPSTRNYRIKTTRNAARLSLALALLLGIGFFLTPQGQVAAQSLLRFFQIAGSNFLPLPAGQATEAALFIQTPTTVPTQIVSLAAPASGDFSTPTPEERSQQGSVTYGLSIAEAEELAGFEVRSPQSLPSGYRLADVMYDDQSGEVQQVYKYFPYQAGEMFTISQQASQPAPFPVGQSADVEQTLVENVVVESASGTWFNTLGSAQEEWISDAPVYTFRWQQDGFYFTMQFMVGDTFSPAYLSADGMQSIVGALIGGQAVALETTNLNNLASIAEVREVADFEVLAPTLLPQGFVLERAVYETDTKRAVLIFRPTDTAGDSNSPSLVIYEILRSGQETASAAPQEGLPPETIEAVNVGPYPGTFQHGSASDEQYDPSSIPSLHWETEELSITINYFGSPSHPAQLGKEEMLAIADGLQ